MTALQDAPPVITEPGVYDLSELRYHSDPTQDGSLSSTGARRLLPPSCPARFRCEQDHPVYKRAFDLGHAAHREVLGVGLDIKVIHAANYNTKKAQQERDAARAAGKAPLLDHEREQVTEMATALRNDENARMLLNPEHGAFEQSLFWRDPRTQVFCRARLDFLRFGLRRLIVVDYKTTKSAELSDIGKSMVNYGYHQQAGWYLDGVNALDLGPDPAFLFVFQETTPPYVVQVVEPDLDMLLRGQRRNRKAIDIYRQCRETDTWPGYSDEILPVSMPRWAVFADDDLAYSGAYDTREDQQQ